MDDLTTWLRAQLDDDERVARAVQLHLWTVSTPPPDVAPITLVANAGGSHYSHLAEGVRMHDPDGAVLHHAARWDPARVLAEVDAKRRIIDRYEDAVARQSDDDYSLIAADVQAEEYRDWVLPLLALPYADRPGYRSEWAP